MKKIIFLFSLSVTVLCFSQEKNIFKNTDQVISAIEPNTIKTWQLIKSDGQKEAILTNKLNLNHEKQSEGFKLNPNDDIFYYIAYKKGKHIQYITDLQDLKPFIGSINSPEKAALVAITEGYYIDLEFENIAGSYSEDNENYYVNIGKITSKKCPFEKTSFLLTINKKTGEIVETQKMEKYQEVYLKDCENNPHRFIPPKKKKEKEVISIYG